VDDRPVAARATVSVWVAPLDPAPAVLSSLDAALSPAERERTAKFRHARDARRFAAAHGWLRLVLGAAVGTPAAAVTFAPGPGKPRLAGPGHAGSPCFNLSHGGELALIAVADREVGVDVEPLDGGDVARGTVGLVCTPAEAAALEGLGAPERAGAFLALWTVKEAYLKATGDGLAVPPADVDVGRVPLPAAGTAVPVASPGQPTRWWARPLRPAPGYVGAVVAEGDRWDVVVRSVFELARLPASPG
jgi:4'-phosphopantetheinyl transferase